MLTFMNIMAAGLHSIDFMTGMNGGRGVILDFVGQCRSLLLRFMRFVADCPATPASLTRIVVLDLLIWLCQLVSLEVTFITAHAGNIPHSTSFPYPDYLLPPSYTSATKVESGLDDEEDDKAEDDVESGLKRRRRKGFESAFEELDGEMDALWLNEDDGPGGRPRGEHYSHPQNYVLIYSIFVESLTARWPRYKNTRTPSDLLPFLHPHDLPHVRITITKSSTSSFRRGYT
jgi:hypothetical protein